MLAGLHSAIGGLGWELGTDSQWYSDFKEELTRQRIIEERKHREDRRHEKLQQYRKELRSTRSELERLRKENELLRSENDLLRTEAADHEAADQKLAPGAMTEANQVSLRYAAFMLPKFDGTDPKDYAQTWLKMIAANASIFSWTNNETLLAARISLEGEARQWMTAQRRDVLEWKGFRDAFKARFCDRDYTVPKVHLALSTRKRKRSEKITEYLTEMEELAARIQLDEDDLKMYIINGLLDDEPVKTGLRNMDMTLKELKKHLEHSERSIFDADDIELKDTGKRCYSCYEKGHYYTSCRNYDEASWILNLIIIVFLLFLCAPQ